MQRAIFSVGIFIFSFFVFFSYLVHKDIFTHLDFDTTVKIQDKLPEVLVGPFSVFSLIGSAEVTSITILLIGIFLLRGIKRLILWGAFVGVGLIEIFGKLFVTHEGPPFLFLKTNLFVHFPSNYIPHEFFAYPSGHSARTAFICIVLAIIILSSKRLGDGAKILTLLTLAIFAFVMFISRVYLGEHWSTDVVGGLLLGVSLGLVSIAFNVENSQR